MPDPGNAIEPPLMEGKGIMLLINLLYPGGLLVQDITNGQYNAAKWIVQSDARNLDTTVLMPELAESYALASLYFSTSGDNWKTTSTTQWLSIVPHCSWDFVECQQHSVVSMEASSQGLAGTLPSDIKFLTSLIALDLSGNSFDGSSIPIELFSLTNLTSLNLQRNKFTGSIPAEIGRLSALEKLKLGWNAFEGSVPAEFGSLSMLSYFEAQGNRLKGTINIHISITNK